MLVIIMRLQLGKVWNKWASHVPSHSGNVLGLRIFSAEFNAYRKILHWQPWKIKPLFPDSKSMPSRKMISLQFLINRLPDVLWKMGFSVWETQLLCPLLTAEWPSSCLLQTLLGSVRWLLLAAGHPDVANPTKAMYMSVLVLCKLGDGLQHLPLENMIAPQLLPAPNPASSPGGTRPYMFFIFCPDFLT